jgi:hypothetical protein
MDLFKRQVASLREGRDNRAGHIDHVDDAKVVSTSLTIAAEHFRLLSLSHLAVKRSLQHLTSLTSYVSSLSHHCFAYYSTSSLLFDVGIVIVYRQRHHERSSILLMSNGILVHFVCDDTSLHCIDCCIRVRLRTIERDQARSRILLPTSSFLPSLF